jgi:hypothetical protein
VRERERESERERERERERVGEEGEEEGSSRRGCRWERAEKGFIHTSEIASE